MFINILIRSFFIQSEVMINIMLCVVGHMFLRANVHFLQRSNGDSICNLTTMHFRVASRSLYSLPYNIHFMFTARLHSTRSFVKYFVCCVVRHAGTPPWYRLGTRTRYAINSHALHRQRKPKRRSHARFNATGIGWYIGRAQRILSRFVLKHR